MYSPFIRFLIIISFFTVALLVYHCATPTQPTGGPADRTPPEIEETEPPAGTTMFDGDRIRFHFSKYINRNSFRNAFQMEPDLNLDYDISWRRRTATIRFNDPLPDTTTIIFTLGTDLADARNNRITSPFQFAISTGPDIDEGSITATVRDARTGQGKGGERVVLYRYPVDLAVGANYVAESDTAGLVQFNYLREGKYKAFWLDDRNRNRRWDREREAAQPFSTDSLMLEKAGEADLGKVFLIRRDTIPPMLQAVGMLSDIRLRLRFSENIELDDEAAISVFHEDHTHKTDAVPLYVEPDNPNILLAQSREPLADGEFYHLELHGISDEAGNSAGFDIEAFPGSDEQDTTYARYISNDSRYGVRPDEPIVIRYAKLLENTPVVLDSLIVVQSEETYNPWPHAEISDHKLLIFPDGQWIQGENYEIRVWDDERLERRTIQPRILFEDELGGLSVEVEQPRADTTMHRLQLTDEQGVIIHDEQFQTEANLAGLPAGRYTLRVYEIREGYREWDSGQVDPYRSPAHYFIQRNVPVERGLTGQIYVEWQ